MIKVLIVDDSIIFRRILQDTLQKNPRIKVIGTAENGVEAIKLIRTLRPDVVVLDVEMPQKDGIETLDELKRLRLQVGIIMFSTLTTQGAKITLEALSKGAFDFVQKPTGTRAFSESQKKIEQELIPKIIACADFMNRKGGLRRTPPSTKTVNQKSRPIPSALKTQTILNRVTDLRKMAQRPEAVAIGVSTGGPNALSEVIPKFPANFRLPIFLVQHMPPVFTKQLADRLNSKSKLLVKEAENGELVKPGTVYIAPGDFHMKIIRNDSNHLVRLSQDPPVNSCRPAVDPLFESLADAYRGRVVGVVMTGMGQDGTNGCRVLKAKGAYIIAQDEETSVVYGMPRFVVEAGLADKICPLDMITQSILEICRN
ncbi:Chemotaxis response regulator protein-glutamate methylesterase CheB [Dissulfuribacter thermophilus]|uniref:Protein-glutamate methylesterase/protein-glutamine glutaminase n=1 Tax=Dissulfuribacter thermophilus TaxID=1156395 RepID=A0A1B9F990_9BACT|nr:chemotaxis response regulator protein-glutamate methylesterase [Dissulfuribacter thermophilus]OCC16487.1 Chemotaxis response regulator protein-glutamate methylesterase CheB [Dissulfuribacter thermophilus]